MSTSMHSRRSSDLVRLPEKTGPANLKVGLKSDHIGLGEIAFECLCAHYGSVKELAFALGQCDPSLARRELKECDFSRFNKHADQSAKAALAESVNNAWGALRSPEEAAALAVKEARHRLDILAEYIAYRDGSLPLQRREA